VLAFYKEDSQSLIKKITIARHDRTKYNSQCVKGFWCLTPFSTVFQLYHRHYNSVLNNNQITIHYYENHSRGGV